MVDVSEAVECRSADEDVIKVQWVLLPDAQAFGPFLPILSHGALSIPGSQGQNLDGGADGDDGDAEDGVIRVLRRE